VFEREIGRERERATRTSRADGSGEETMMADWGVSVAVAREALRHDRASSSTLLACALSVSV
jgi:hypothetical protein